MSDLAPDSHSAAVAQRLAAGEPQVWFAPPRAQRPADAAPLTETEMRDAAAFLRRMRPLLRTSLGEQWPDGEMLSPLIPSQLASPLSMQVKGDHLLPLAGSVKFRGGVFEILCHLDQLADRHDLPRIAHGVLDVAAPQTKAVLAQEQIVVASTGNLGFGIGVLARAFGLGAQVHMSHEAKAWKKDRLRRIGVEVVEHDGDYRTAVTAARAVTDASAAYFIDDERSRKLLVGYSLAAPELAYQLARDGVTVSRTHPMVVYLPCGVGGAPGGITAGLKAIYGANVTCVFVEPTQSACMLAALTHGGQVTDIYGLGLTNATVADGLAVPAASPTALAAVGQAIDAVVTLSDSDMLHWVHTAWREERLMLEPSAAAALGAVPRFVEAAEQSSNLTFDPRQATHVAWATGGSLLPPDEFERLLAAR
jgi:D-serine dehydratase